MSVTKFKMLSNRLKAVLLGTAIALIGVLAIAPAVSLASTSQDLLPAPVLIGPPDGALMVVPVPTFSWQAVSGAVSYNVELAYDPDFVSSAGGYYSTTTSVQSFPQQPGVYYWRVGASDTDSNVGAYSEVRSFTIHQMGDPLQGICATQSNNSYKSVPVEQYDLDNPVRYAAENGDKNVSLRGMDFRPDQPAAFLDYGPPSDSQMPPQLATLFGPPFRVPEFGTRWKVYGWEWFESPDPGYSTGSGLENVAIHGLGLKTGGVNVPLHSPRHGRNLGNPVGQGGAIVLYADVNSITLKFTREDSVATGYTMHFMYICTDPNLVALYQALDNEDRNSTGEGSGNTPRDGVFDYSLPGLKQGQVFGTSAGGDEVTVFIRDIGTFLDPRSITDWWQIGN